MPSSSSRGGRGRKPSSVGSVGWRSLECAQHSRVPSQQARQTGNSKPKPSQPQRTGARRTKKGAVFRRDNKDITHVTIVSNDDDTPAWNTTNRVWDDFLRAGPMEGRRTPKTIAQVEPFWMEKPFNPSVMHHCPTLDHLCPRSFGSPHFSERAIDRSMQSKGARGLWPDPVDGFRGDGLCMVKTFTS